MQEMRLNLRRAKSVLLGPREDVFAGKDAVNQGRERNLKSALHKFDVVDVRSFGKNVEFMQA